MSKKSIAALIVAAGMSSRMHDFKPILKIGELTIAERVVMNFKRAGVSEIVVITGNRAESVEELVKDKGVVCIFNDKYETTQMFDSIKIGLRHLKGKCDRIFIIPIDVPLFNAKTLEKLMDKEGAVVHPVCQGLKGHPLLIDAALVEEVLSYTGDSGLKGAIDFLGVQEADVDVDDIGVLLDADTQEDYNTLLDVYAAQREEHFNFKKGVK